MKGNADICHLLKCEFLNLSPAPIIREEQISLNQAETSKSRERKRADPSSQLMQTLQQSQLLQNSAEPANNQSELEAPPKQVAQAMERLNQAARVIADIRLGADRILEAMLVASQPRHTDMPLQLFLTEDASMRQHLQELRLIGKKLEESGVLTESLRSRSNSWGLHMPLVCPDGAVVAYAWKRQLAGQAGASAVDRTRLALRAFTDQKRRYFPHIDDGLKMEPRSKKHRASHSLVEHGGEEPIDYKTLPDIQSSLEKMVPNVKVSTYGRLNWLKRANSLPGSGSDDPTEAANPIFQSSSKLRSGLQSEVVDKVAVVELSFPSVFRAIVSLNPAGSVDPDAVAFFSPDEGGSYMHGRGLSVHHIYKHITEHAATVLQYFLGFGGTGTALYSLLLWICSFESLFSKPCSKCGKLLAMDKKSCLILPPLRRSYQELPSAVKTGEVDLDLCEAYHFDCSLDDSS